MSITGDYRSMAEAVGEAPPQTGITGSEYEEILHDCAYDYDMAAEIVGHIDHVQERDYRAWHHGRVDQDSYDAGYRQALIDNGLDPDDYGEREA